MTECQFRAAYANRACPKCGGDVLGGKPDKPCSGYVSADWLKKRWIVGDVAFRNLVRRGALQPIEINDPGHRARIVFDKERANAVLRDVVEKRKEKRDGSNRKAN
jgi:hypothetical protein